MHKLLSQQLWWFVTGVDAVATGWLGTRIARKLLAKRREAGARAGAGQAAVEYALILAAVAVVCYGAYEAFSAVVSAYMTGMIGSLNG